MKNYKLLSIVIPVYNEEKTVKQLIEKVVKSDTLDLKKEIIIVNDGSSDGTMGLLKKIGKDLSNKKVNLTIVNKKINEGKGAALITGFKKTKGDLVIVQDADLEYNPNEYPRLIEPIINGYADVVYGSRFITDRPHRVLYYWHSIGNKFITTLSNIFTNLNLTDMETCYKLFRGDIIRKIAPELKSKRFGFEPEITARISKIKNIRIYEVGISYSGRTYEEGKKINWLDGIKTLWEIIYFNIISERTNL